MFCSGECEGCGLLWDITLENEKGERRDEKQCGLFAMFGELMEIRRRLLGVQQATEGNRNVGDQVGRALVNVFDKGFNKMAKAQLIRDNPALAVIDDD